MSDIKLYLRYISICIQSQLEYRASFIMMTIGHFCVNFIEFLGIWVLFKRFGNLEGFTLKEAALLYGMVHVAFATSECFARGFDVFPRLIRSGDFDRALLRPRGLVLQVIGHDFQIMRIGRFTQGFIVLIWAIVALKIKWTIFKVVLFIAAIVGGSFLFSGIIVLQAAFSFWSVQSLEIFNSFTYGGVEASQFPISIYNDWFRKFFIFVIPLASINYFPILAILDRVDTLGFPQAVRWVSPIVGFVFFFVSIMIWKVGVKHYHSTGS